MEAKGNNILQNKNGAFQQKGYVKGSVCLSYTSVDKPIFLFSTFKP